MHRFSPERCPFECNERASVSAAIGRRSDKILVVDTVKYIYVISLTNRLTHALQIRPILPAHIDTKSFGLFEFQKSHGSAPRLNADVCGKGLVSSPPQNNSIPPLFGNLAIRFAQQAIQLRNRHAVGNGTQHIEFSCASIYACV